MSGNHKRRAIGNRLKDAFTKNIGLKIGAAVFAFILWAFVMADQNPMRERVFSSIPVTYTNVDSLRQKDLIAGEPFIEALNEVTIVVTGNADRIYLLTEGMLSAEVDLSKINDAGEQMLVITPKSDMTGLELSAEPKDVMLNIEPIAILDVPVEVQLEGEQKSWLYYGEPVLSEPTVEVSGAWSNVEQAVKAVCKINIDSLEASTRETRLVSILDEDGNELPAKMFSSVPSVIVEMPIFPKKTVAIDLRNILDTTTGVADGYEITGIKVDPETVQIAGNLQNINTISSIRLTSIVLDNAATDQTVSADVIVPKDIYAVMPEEIQVTLTIKPQQDKQTYAAVNIDVKNLGEGLIAVLRPETVDVDASGAKNDLNAFKAEQLRPFVDLHGLTSGIYTVVIKFENEPDIDVQLVPSVTSVTVVIT